jgi:pantoate--beta-alanine ligase
MVIDDLDVWRSQRDEWRSAGHSVGFVPTMGALHEGHLSLVERSVAENDRTVVSILVNPTQFDEQGDLDSYPRDLERDTSLLERADVHAVLVPDPDAIYRDGYRYRVTETDRSRSLEGACRPGHFDGVLTVVLKLLHIVEPGRAYFGEKDWQQLELVRGMADALVLDTRIIGCPIVREADGLAMSSRNVRLDSFARARAAEFASVLQVGGSAEQVRSRLVDLGIDVDYVERRDGRLLAAVRIGGVRLIDNVTAGPDSPPDIPPPPAP